MNEEQEQMNKLRLFVAGGKDKDWEWPAEWGPDLRAPSAPSARSARVTVRLLKTVYTALQNLAHSRRESVPKTIEFLLKHYEQSS